MKKKEKEEIIFEEPKMKKILTWICYGMMFGAIIGMSLTFAKDKLVYQFGGIIVGIIIGTIIGVLNKKGE